MKKLVDVIADALIERGWIKLHDVKPNRIGEVFEWVKDGNKAMTMMEAMELQESEDEYDGEG